jgi:hypothetical protein
MIELISGRAYYGRCGSGWVVLVNGHPHHEPTKADAMKFLCMIGRNNEPDAAGRDAGGVP